MRLALIVSAATLFLAPTAAQRAINAQEAIPAPLTIARQRIETSDYRASARLVRTDADGHRVTVPIKIEAHWFPGVLREVVEISPAHGSAGDPDPDARLRILFEMRPGGQSTIRVFHPHQPEAAPLAFEKWSEGVAGSDFSYEDFLNAEYYWRGQTLLKSNRIGARDCDTLKSTPGGTDRSHYAQVETCLDHTIGYPLYVEKTPKGGAGVKEFTSLGVSKSGGVWYARQVEVKVHGRPGSTVLIVERGSAKANLTPKDFTTDQISRF